MSDALNLSIPFSPAFESNPTLNSLSLNDTDNAIAVVFQARNTEPITHIGMRHTSTTGVSPTYKASVQGVNTSGQPDGTIKGGGSPASATFSPTSLGWGASTWNWVALDNAYTPSRGEDLALNVVYDSGVVSGVLFSSFGYYLGSPGIAKPSPLDFQTSWTKRIGQSVLAYKTGTSSYLLPLQSVANTTFQSGSSPNEYALRFTLPSTWGSTFQIGGFSLVASLPVASTYTVTLYDGGGAADTTALQTLSASDGDFTASGNRIHRLRFSDATLATLNFGSTYRIGIRAGGAVNATIYYADVASNSDFSAWPLGIECYMSTRAGVNWTDVTTRRPYGELLLNDITGSAGATTSALILPGISQTGMRVF